jgi:hypothetical protein
MQAALPPIQPARTTNALSPLPFLLALFIGLDRGLEESRVGGENVKPSLHGYAPARRLRDPMRSCLSYVEVEERSLVCKLDAVLLAWSPGDYFL